MRNIAIRCSWWFLLSAMLPPLASGAATSAQPPVVRVHYLGHASFVLDFGPGIRVLTDYGKSRAYGLDSPVFGLGGLVPDAATFSHGHEDHAGGELPEGVRRVLRDGAGIELGGVMVVPIPTFERSLDRPDNTSYLFEYGGLKILHLGDCQALIVNAGRPDVQSRIRQLYPDSYDLILLPIGFVTDIVKPAADFLALLKTHAVVPMHYWRSADKERFLEVLQDQDGRRGGFSISRIEGPGLTVSPGESAAGKVRVVSLEPAAWTDGPNPLARVAIPLGTGILPNGRFALGEWEDACEVEIAEGVSLHLKHDAVYLYLGIEFQAEMHTGVDLFVGNGGDRRMKLHVSAALGEAEWKDGSWTDIAWGKNTLWMANGIGMIVENGERKVVPLEGFEFQIARSLLPGETWRLFVHLKRPERFVPPGASASASDRWLEVSFSTTRASRREAVRHDAGVAQNFIVELPSEEEPPG